MLGAIGYGIGALTAFGVLALPDPDPSDHGAIAAVAGVLALTAAAMAAAGPDSRLVGVGPLWGVLCVSALVAVGRPLAAVPLFFIWPVLHAAYFLNRRSLIAVEATMLASYAIALQWSPPGQRMAYFLAVAVSSLMIATVIRHLRERVERLVTSLDAAASTDPLTGLLNRRAFEAEFEAELVRSARYRRPLSLAVFDLDHFKSVNDHFGHDVGDTTLCRTAVTLDRDRRASDVVARLGGEEFAILFVDTDGAAAHDAAVRVAEQLRQWPEEDVVHVSISAGVAELGPDLNGRVEMMRAADAALYEAKAAGRRRVVSNGGQVTLIGAADAGLTAASRTRTPLPGT